jgi:hypothetical protein
MVKAPSQPFRNWFGCLSPQGGSMGEMGSERMHQAHLTIRKLMEIAVRKRGRLKIR